MATINKVNTGKTYMFDPIGWDLFDPKTTLKKGDLVTVVKLDNCPPPNTMGHCHVNFNGQFAGLVHCNSLKPVDGGNIINKH